MKTIIKYLLILPLIAVTSCLREQFDDPSPCPCEGEKDVTLKLSLPYIAPQGPVTRAIDTGQENAIAAIDVLAFKVENGEETFLYWASGKRAAGKDGDPTQSFTAALRVADYPQRFVIISNARGRIETLMGSRTSGGWTGTDKEALLAQLTLDLNGGDRWKAIDASNYTAIPMWGQTDAKITNATTTINAIKMLRMIAKIEVQLDESVAGLTGKFKLQSVHVYNTNTSGRIVPKPGTEYVGTDMIARKPSLPDGVKTAVGPLEYTDFNYPGKENIAMRGAIYLFEATAKDEDKYLEQTCIVVGGKYGTDDAAPTTYYRLDMMDKNGKRLDILRNHAFICNIAAVNGPGEPTVDKAFKSKPVNMSVNILDWNEGDIRDMDVNGQYILSVNRNPVILSEDAHDINSADNILKITTNYPTGWIAEVSASKTGKQYCNWLDITPENGAGDAQPADVHLLTGANSDGQSREAYIHIKAGRLTYIVTVRQEAVLGGITVTPGEWLLPHTIPAGAKYTVNVACKKPDGTDASNLPWTLASADHSWCRLSTDPTASFGSANASLSGNGTKNIYIIAANNKDKNPRTAFIYKDGNPSDIAVKVIQWGDPTTITDKEGAGNAPKNALTCVGAFWKNNQTGERLVKILGTGDPGAWTATVMWQDARWESGDGVVLNGSDSADPNKYTLNHGDAENYQVDGYATTITGDTKSGYISFRIGLKTKYTPKKDYPVRYAVVLLSYANNTKFQKIFLRQGEDADFLMMNGDRIPRPKSVKFSPYNLTAVNLDAVVDKSSATSPKNPAKFVDYPTQAGAFFQWANDYYENTGFKGGQRWAWKPYEGSQHQMYKLVAPGTYWDTLGKDNEISPDGYRRPDDGSISGQETGGTTNSEVRQSLFNHPIAGYNYNNYTDNSCWGYYADGFFALTQEDFLKFGIVGIRKQYYGITCRITRFRRIFRFQSDAEGDISVHHVSCYGSGISVHLIIFSIARICRAYGFVGAVVSVEYHSVAAFPTCILPHHGCRPCAEVFICPNFDKAFAGLVVSPKCAYTGECVLWSVSCAFLVGNDSRVAPLYHFYRNVRRVAVLVNKGCSRIFVCIVYGYDIDFFRAEVRNGS
jgi:hypothetical protein